MYIVELHFENKTLSFEYENYAMAICRFRKMTDLKKSNKQDYIDGVLIDFNYVMFIQFLNTEDKDEHISHWNNS